MKKVTEVMRGIYQEFGLEIDRVPSEIQPQVNELVRKIARLRAELRRRWKDPLAPPVMGGY